MMRRNQSSLLACVAVFAWAILATSVGAAPATEQEPSRAYWLGLARYLAERGYIAALCPRIESNEVEIYYKRIPVSKELGGTIDFRFSIPSWHIEGRLRKANFKIEETGEWIRNKEFRIDTVTLLRGEVADSSWKAVHTDADEIYKTKRDSDRPLSLELKEAILSQIVHHAVGPSQLTNYRFSSLLPFENQLWIYDMVTGNLYGVRSGADLDDLDSVRHGGVDWRGSHDRHDTDLADGPLGRMVARENVVWLHGLWAALGGN